MPVRKAGLRTRFRVKKKGKDVIIKIKTVFADVRVPTHNRTCSKGWAKRCAKSKGKKCECKCKGDNHGTKRRWPKILKWRPKTKIKNYVPDKTRPQKKRPVE